MDLFGAPAGKGAFLFIRTGGCMPGEATWKLEKLIETCNEEKTLEIRTIEEKEWPQRSGADPEKSALERRNWISIGEYVDPPLSKYVDIIDEMQEKMVAAVGDKARAARFSFSGWGPLVMWPMINILRNAWDVLKPETKEELENMQIWRDYWAAYGRSSVGFFPSYAECWKAHYGPTSYRLLKGLKRLFDPKNILNPTNIPQEG